MNRYAVRYALMLGAAAVLAACGATQLPIGAPGSMPQSRTPATHTESGGSWMLPEAKAENLLYVSDELSGDVDVYRYWQQKRVGVLTGFKEPTGECADGQGDVYIVDFKANDIVEYSHARKSPTKILSDGPYSPLGCAIDPLNGDLAVANWWEGGLSGSGSLAIYRHAQGKPTFYTDPYLYRFESCAYDDKGNLLTTNADYNDSGYGSQFAYMAKGSKSLFDIDISGGSSWGGGFDGVQGIAWDGKYFVLNDELSSEVLYRVAIRRDHGRVVGRTYLDEQWDLGPIAIYNNHSGSEGTQVVGASGYDEVSVTYWKYPAGGPPTAQITKNLQRPYGLAISLKQ